MSRERRQRPQSRNSQGSSQRSTATQSTQRNTASQSSQRNIASQSSRRTNGLRSSQSDSQWEPGSSSQNSQRTAVTAEELDNLVSDAVQYILVQDHHKHPIKQLDIKKNALKLHSKHYKEVMNRAKDVLLQTFGYRLVEVEPDSPKSYILVNNIADSFSPTEKEEPRYVLLLLVLSLIFMCGGCVTDDVMWRFLSRLKIFQENVQHSYFGDVQKLMTQEFVRQLYLKYIRIPDTDPAKYEFRWGKRSEEEVDKKVLLQFVGKMFGQDDLSVWTAQYEEVNQQETANGGRTK